MPAAQREFPYIWATWLPRLLTGENSCECAVRYKAHHQNWEGVPSDFDQAQRRVALQIRHAAARSTRSRENLHQTRQRA